MLPIEKNYIKEKNYTKRFILYSYALFWIMILILGGIFVLSGQKTWIMKWGAPLCSWAPTIALLVLFKKLYPDITIKDFYKKAFSQKICIPLILAVTVIYALLITVVVFMVSVRNNVTFTSLWNLSSSTLLSGFFFTMISGPMGEESGWRGYLQHVMWKKAGVIKGALMLSVVWSFWHTPLWFMPGYVGIKLLVYIMLFLLGNICLSLIISICYDCNKNLFVPIWIHFMSNAMEVPYLGDGFEGRLWLGVFYPIVALGFVLWYKRRISRKSEYS